MILKLPNKLIYPLFYGTVNPKPKKEPLSTHVNLILVPTCEATKQ